MIPRDRIVGRIDKVAVRISGAGIDLPAVQLVVRRWANGGILRIDCVDYILDLKIVLLVEHVMDRSKPDVLIHTAIAGNIVITHRGQENLSHCVVNGTRRCGDTEIAEVNPKAQCAGAGVTSVRKMIGRAGAA